ncbi:hypothetical protein [Alphaspiravirus yamagawaense]|uniref:Uncharacterized protein n=1 Tax=Alphaspiravirus yamagawaense TaxID=1157339 RepID=J7Q327_9VIRU|nr:hypothetical protein [Aeropyrum coil-shaped virus]CCG27843.1 hypothetical protein [Aeropyrum coil-shaped virus]
MLRSIALRLGVDGMKVRDFWRRYLEADDVERLDLIKGLLERHIHACYTIYKDNRVLGVHCLVSIVNSFFLDLIRVLGEERDGLREE